MELFRRWGVADVVRAAAPLAPDWCRRVVFCTTTAEPAITEFRDVFGLGAADQGLAAEAGQQVPQPVVEQVLRDHLQAHPLVDLRLGERLVRFVEAPDAVSCELERLDGSRYSVRAAYLLGCDGSRSTVRDGIGAALHGSSAPRANLNAVFRSRGLTPAAGRGLHYWVVGTDIPGAVGPLDHDGTWWASLAGAGDIDDATVASTLIARLAGRPDLDVELLSTDPWTPRMLLADRFSTERVFLVGESAHVNPPFGGHGFNTCVGDAVNIGWKIAALLRGWGGRTLLASYELERRSVAEQTLASAVRNLEASGPGHATNGEEIQATKSEEFHSLGLVLGYSYAGSPVVADAEPTTSDVQHYVPSTGPGSRLPHVWVGPGRALYDDLGPGLTLIHPPGADAAAIARLTAEARGRGLPWTVLPAPAGVVWTESLLVRPDQHIAWRGRDLTTADLSLFCGTTSPEEVPCG